YAREKLADRGALSTFLTAHCNQYLTLAKAANRGLQGPEQGEWTRRVEADLDNIRAGMSLALQGGVDPILAVKFAVAVLGFWMLRGYATEGATTCARRLRCLPCKRPIWRERTRSMSARDSPT